MQTPNNPRLEGLKRYTTIPEGTLFDEDNEVVRERGEFVRLSDVAALAPQGEVP